MATLSKGHSFSAGATLDSSGLDDLIHLATLTAVSRNDVDRSSGSPLFVQSQELGSPQSGEVWVENTYNVASVYDGTNWLGLTPSFMTVKAQQAITGGQVVRPGSNGVTSGIPWVVLAGDSNHGSEIGVMSRSVSLNEVAAITVSGVADISTDGSPGVGDLLKISTTTPGNVMVDNSLGLGDYRIFAIAIRGVSGGRVLAWLRR